VAELPGLGEQDPVWPWVTSTRENCVGAECPKFDECFVLAARREAQAADIVVVNHYLLMADLVLKEEGFGDLLPGADAIVIDEAHQLPDVAAQFLGYSVSTRQLASLCKDVAGELLLVHQMSGKVDGALSGLDAQIANVVAASAGQEARLEHGQWSERLLESLTTLGARAHDLAEAIAPLGGADGQAAFTRLQERLAESADRLQSLTAADAPGGVRWAELGPRNVSAHFAPVDVATQLAALMESQPCAWVLTSATLAVGDDFSHFKRRCGLSHATTVRFESPFDFPNQALLYLPKGLGEPNAPGHAREVVRAALPVLEASGGRAFILFTSHRGLREGAEELYAHWGERPPYPVLIQGAASRDQMLRTFREAGNAVLLGTGSFWEGIDVKGEALSVVIIDKLPFAAPDDPLLKARLEAIRAQGGNPFFDEQVPQAVISLKQGVGRLIRDESDSGVVMICDTRLVTKGYGRSFINSLPPMRRTRALEDVQAFLRERLGVPQAEQA
jgi:ATP-dependent DNA helicase DinG